MAGIYIHVPFCKQACYYCDFHFSTNRELQDSLVDSLAREMYLQRNYLQGEVLETIYLGGGTPSLLTKEQLELLFNTIHKNFRVKPGAEVTIEANPDDLTNEKLALLRGEGVNRLSVGIQSFSDDVLRFFHRAHSSREALETYGRARSAGFENISIDLIYGVPIASPTTWHDDLKRAIELNPEHISTYSLTIEEKTVFGKWHATGKLQATEEEIVAQQFEWLMVEMEKAGYRHYEISNFAKPGFESQHNSSYWKQRKYLGIGPSAHSFDGTSRQYNIRNNALYVKAITNDSVPFEREVLSDANKVNEYLLTTLRTSWGCDTVWLKSTLQFEWTDEQRLYLDKIIQNGLAELSETHLVLTRKGKLLADKIASDLFVDDDFKLANFRP